MGNASIDRSVPEKSLLHEASTNRLFRLINACGLRVLQFWASLGSWRAGLLYFVMVIPFATFRQIRIHGDEKVYVGQALEMFRAGHFWQQLQFGEINYIKGPLHYILLIIGQGLFGLSMFSTVYMNVLLAGLAVVSLMSASRYLFPELKRLQFLPATVFATCGSYVLFGFSSQMESELTSLYAIALSLSVLARFEHKTSHYLLLWLSVGLAGALKSPLHSILLGLSVLAYFFTFEGGWSKLLLVRNRLFFLAIAMIVCAVGYLIPYLLDRQPWIAGYILREQINRPKFADSVPAFFYNNFFLHLIPWCFLIVSATKGVVSDIYRRRFYLTEATRTGLCYVMPTLIFFSLGGYVAPWYGLPMLAGIVLLLLDRVFVSAGRRMSPQPLGAEVQSEVESGIASKIASKIEWTVVKRLTWSIFPWIFIIAIAVLLTHVHFFEGTSWWSWQAAAVCLVLLSVALWISVVRAGYGNWAPHAVIVPMISCFWASALILSTCFGEAELADARKALQLRYSPFMFSNISLNNYNEWGYMAHMLGVNTYYALSNDELLNAARSGNWLVFATEEEYGSYWSWIKERGLEANFSACSTTLFWRRWPRNLPQFWEVWNRNIDSENSWERSTRKMILYNAGRC